jgi:hypothetical protein
MQRSYAIHPGIGIARVGDSPEDYFVGPEAPGCPPSLAKPDSPAKSDGLYKDGQGRVKRQGARFRIFETTTDDSGKHRAVREITAADAKVEWTVHLANAKAAAPSFTFSADEPVTRRNAGIPEHQLVIDAGAQRIEGRAQGFMRLKGSFQGVEVPLGDLLTDHAGRLIVLGGFGTSRSVRPLPLEDFVNNDGWCDDVSDGPVRATIQLNGSDQTIEAEPAWVIVAPPDFAPAIESVVTLYDVVYNIMSKSVDKSLAVTKDTVISFSRDICPILRRVSTLHWVSNVASAGHGPGNRMHFLSRMSELANNSGDAAARLRAVIFKKLRTPSGAGGNMPKLPASLTESDVINETVALTECQYERMRRWAAGTFESDWPTSGGLPPPSRLEDLPVHDAPAALDRAALEACVGGGFFPGIEVGRVMLEESTYAAHTPFRINPRLSAGALTARMAIPWQADFFECALQSDPDAVPGDPGNGMDWWPAQRPVNVLRGRAEPEEWASGIDSKQAMVGKWAGLGFVVREEGTERFVETERSIEDVET